MNPISVKIVFINICENFQRNLHTRVWKGLIGLYKLEPQGRIVAATFFPAVQYLLGIRAGQPVHFPLFRVEYLSDIRAGLCLYIFHFSEYNISTICAGAHFAECNISTIRAGLYIFLLAECRVHISTILSAISPTFAPAHRVAFSELENLNRN